MGNEWHGEHPETEYVSKAAQEHRARISDAVAERERADRLMSQDRTLYRVALTEFTQRVKALPELGGAEGSDQQLAELEVIGSLFTTVRSRAAVMRSRRTDGTGISHAEHLNRQREAKTLAAGAPLGGFPGTVESVCRRCQEPKPSGELAVGDGVCAKCDLI